jgi:hypothetical protein
MVLELFVRQGLNALWDMHTAVSTYPGNEQGMKALMPSAKNG